MTWLVASLAGLAGFFYGLWQRSRASRFEEAWRAAAQIAADERAQHRDTVTRYEALVASYRKEVQRLEAASLAHATPDELRARLTHLLRPPGA